MDTRKGSFSEKKIKHSQGSLSLPKVEYNNLNPEVQNKVFV